MRLIDADVMLKRLEAWNTKDNIDRALYNFAYHRIIEQPTAYDVDKVVDGVNEALDRLFNFCEEIDLHIPEDERTGYKMLNDIWAIRDIVERGGLNDTRRSNKDYRNSKSRG